MSRRVRSEETRPLWLRRARARYQSRPTWKRNTASARGVGDALVPDYDQTELTALRKSAAVIQDVIRQAGL
ncbi:MAG TPA: hypothetical protein VMZ31_10240 [Phycisphaerae bacterium]|nr:hypothetical protein [Phycisphaerae bacterium]